MTHIDQMRMDDTHRIECGLMTHMDKMRLGQVGALPAAALALALAYWMLRTVFQPAGCNCLDYRF